MEQKGNIIIGDYYRVTDGLEELLNLSKALWDRF